MLIVTIKWKNVIKLYIYYLNFVKTIRKIGFQKGILQSANITYFWVA